MHRTDRDRRILVVRRPATVGRDRLGEWEYIVATWWPPYGETWASGSYGHTYESAMARAGELV